MNFQVLRLEMLLFVALLCTIASVAADSHSSSADPTESRFSLRKLLQRLDNDTSTTNTTITANTTTPTIPTAPTTPTNVTSAAGVEVRSPLAVFHVVDEGGMVIDEASTNQNIRLKIKALTTMEYQSPYVKKCWYTEYKSSDFNASESVKTEIFLDNGCADENVDLLKISTLPFEENGVLEVQTPLFNLMSLYDDAFAVLDIHCDVTLCQTGITCLVACSKRRKIWKMGPFTEDFELAVSIEVEKQRTTSPPPPPGVKEEDLNDFLISGGKKPPSPRQLKTMEESFLKKYQPYFTVSTLGVVVLLLFCVSGIGCMFISYKNNAESENSADDPSAGYHGSGGMTGLQDNPLKRPLISPPPSYTNASAWPSSTGPPSTDLKVRSPYREPGALSSRETSVLEARQLMRNNLSGSRLPDPRRLALEDDPRDREPGALSHREASVLEARQLMRNNLSGSRLQDPRRLALEDDPRDREPGALTSRETPVLDARQLLRNNMNASRLPDTRRLALEDDIRDGYGYEGVADRVQRNHLHGWNEPPERYREPSDIPTSPVGGELYPAQTSRSRSPSADRMLLKSPVRAQGKASLIGAALTEYFEKYGM